MAVPAPGDGRPVYLHSRHRPRDEAARLVADADVERCLVFYVFGLGLGHHLELLFDRAADEAVFYVFEPDLTLLRTTLGTRDLSRLIDSRRVVFFTAAVDKADLFVRLGTHTTLVTMGTADVVHAASVRRDPAYFRQVGGGWPSSPASPGRT